MIRVLFSSWALFLGVTLLMVGNGMQSTLIGLRAEIENFSTPQISWIISAYFVGFLGGSRLTPEMIRRVGHVRVFAALGSLISAVLIIFPVLTDPHVWFLGRVIIGFSFSGVYVTAESWINNSTTNENRGQALSVYMIMQMLGVMGAQFLLLTDTPAGFVLFIIPSVLVSISFAPILLSVNPTPAFATTKPMTLRQLFNISPLGCVGMFLLGSVFGLQFGMSAIFGARMGLSGLEISTFVSAFYAGALVLQYPLGWLSDRMDRRRLIIIVASLGAVGAALGIYAQGNFTLLVAAAALIGGMSNPLYSLLVSYTNDYIEYEDMASASGGLIFINGVGAIFGPPAAGWLMEHFAPSAFFMVIGGLLLFLSSYAIYRSIRRPVINIDEQMQHAPMMQGTTPVFIEAAQEHAYEKTQEEDAVAEETRLPSSQQ